MVEFNFTAIVEIAFLLCEFMVLKQCSIDFIQTRERKNCFIRIVMQIMNSFLSLLQEFVYICVTFSPNICQMFCFRLKH